MSDEVRTETVAEKWARLSSHEHVFDDWRGDGKVWCAACNVEAEARQTPEPNHSFRATRGDDECRHVCHLPPDHPVHRQTPEPLTLPECTHWDADRGREGHTPWCKARQTPKPTSNTVAERREAVYEAIALLEVAVVQHVEDDAERLRAVPPEYVRR